MLSNFVDLCHKILAPLHVVRNLSPMIWHLTCLKDCIGSLYVNTPFNRLSMEILFNSLPTFFKPGLVSKSLIRNLLSMQQLLL
jgi:hypothetical protein